MSQPEDFNPPWLLDKPAGMSEMQWDQLTLPYWLFARQYFTFTPVGKLFLAPDNVALCITRINQAMSKAIGHPFMIPLSDGDFAQAMAQMANENSKLGFEERNLDILTYQFIDSQTADYYTGWRQWQRYNSWILEQNRMKTMPYGEYSPAQKSVVVDTATYMLSSPWRHAHNEWALNTTGCVAEGGCRRSADQPFFNHYDSPPAYPNQPSPIADTTGICGMIT